MIRPDTDDLIKFLNSLAEIDSVAMGRLLAVRVECNKDLAAHPTVQVRKSTEIPYMHEVGFLGVLNGYAGSYEKGRRVGWGPITAIVMADGRVIRFERTVN